MPSIPRLDTLEDIAAAVAACARCKLHTTRTRTVPGQGHPHPEILFVGEGPGEEEDQQGVAFVGAAGQLLTRIVEAMGLKRDEVFIGNIVKCRPPGNRNPEPDEIAACMPYLRAQIALLRPKIIVALGAVASHALTGETTAITRMRGHWRQFEGIDLMPTFHPSYILRTLSAKRPVWNDMKAVLERLGRQPPK